MWLNKTNDYIQLQNYILGSFYTTNFRHVEYNSNNR